MMMIEELDDDQPHIAQKVTERRWTLHQAPGRGRIEPCPVAAETRNE